MKTSKFTGAQIAFVLKQAEDGAPIAEVCVAGRASVYSESPPDLECSLS